MAQRLGIPHVPGRQLLVGSWVATAVFVVASVVAVSVPGTRTTVAVLDLVMFGLGCVLFLMGFAVAVDRSRYELIGLGGLFFLAGTAPTAVRAHLLGSLTIQVVVAVVAASVRPFSAVAFGILVPMLGLGIAGLWGARHGEFEQRERLATKRPSKRSAHPSGAGGTDHD